MPITLLLSVFFASLLSKKLKGKRFFRIVYFLPNIIMPAAVAMVWRWLLNTRYGLVNIVLGDLGLPTPPGDLRSEIYYDLIDHRGSMEWNRL